MSHPFLSKDKTGQVTEQYLRLLLERAAESWELVDINTALEELNARAKDIPAEDPEKLILFTELVTDLETMKYAIENP